MAAKAAVNVNQARDSLNVLVHELQAGSQVPSAESVKDLVTTSNVLLRHRPRSIPQAQESA